MHGTRVSVLLCLFGLGFLAVPSATAQPLNCVTGSGVAPLLRAESRAELVGDIVITCTGGNPTQVFFVNVDLFLNANITSNIVNAPANETEALLLIDEPEPDVVNTSNNREYTGQVKGSPGVSPGVGPGAGNPGSGNAYLATRMAGFNNRLTWNGIPVVAPNAGQQRILRLTNIRADVTQFPTTGVPPTITAFLNVSPQSSLPLGNPQIQLGTVLPSLEFDTVPGETVQLRFRERFASAFKKRIENAPGGFEVPLPQNRTGVIYNTESGFTPDNFAGTNPGDIGSANTGTRLVARMNGLPAGVIMTALPSVLLTTATGTLTGMQARRVTGFAADFSGGFMLNPVEPPSAVPVVNGTATLVYEITATAPWTGINGASSLDHAVIPVQFAVAQPQRFELEGATVTGGYGPTSSVNVMSQPAPEPRFVPGSTTVPLLVKPVKDFLTLEYVMGDPSPFVVRARADREHRAINETLEFFTLTGGPAWLQVEPEAEPTTEFLKVTINAAGLPEGTYEGAIRFQLTDGMNTLKTLPVVLTVKSTPSLWLDTSPVTITHKLGGPPPAPQIVYVNARVKALVYTATPITTTGGTWLSATPAHAGTPKNLSIVADPTGLAPGSYEGAIEVSAEQAINSPQTIPVTLNVITDGPFISSAGILNAASYAGGAIAPGQGLVIYGLQMGPPDLVTLSVGPDRQLATTLAGVRILFDDIPGPLIYVSATQASVMTPFEVAGRASVQLVVEYNGVRSNPVTLAVAPVAPGIFTGNFMGTGQAAAVNEDGTLNSAANAAPRGTLVSFWLTGAGQTSPAGVTGRVVAASDPLPRVMQQVRVRFAGREGTVQYAGGAVDLAHGFIQVNVWIPGEIAPGEVPLEVQIDDARTQPGVTVAVR